MEPRLRCLIADDEAPARQRLRKLLEVHPAVEVVGEAATGMEAIMMGRELRPDVAFLDIKMPGPGGLEVARQLLQHATPPMIVFVTAFSEHALEAFDVEAVDYLVKPVRMDRLARTLDRLSSARSEGRWQQLLAETLRRLGPGEIAPAAPAPLEQIALKDRETGEREVVRLEDVEWFTSRDEKTYARTRDGQERELAHSLVKLEAMLPGDRFLRTHRAYLVNVRRVIRLVPWFHGAYNLVLESGQEVPLSRNYVAAFQEKVRWL
ncbi:MAG: response regulator transcription factor [Armatimonadetes bacterium]|nr:response regulator transcription factor [Armatimonadota bacterium]